MNILWLVFGLIICTKCQGVPSFTQSRWTSYLRRAGSHFLSAKSSGYGHRYSTYHASRHLGGAKTRLAFHHVWKCGGTMLCDMAYKNGEAVPVGAGGAVQRCDMNFPLYAKGFDDSNVTFASWQYPLPLDDAAMGLGQANSELAFLTMLRNPLDQVLSHFKHVQRIYPGLFSELGAFVDYGWCALNAEGSGEDPASCDKYVSKGHHNEYGAQLYREMPFAVFEDNRQMRWLLGQTRAQLTESDLARAQQRLSLFDEVFILEDFHTLGKQRMKAYGWSNLDDHADQERGWTTVKSNATKELSASVVAKLAELQQWDMKLYHFAQTKLLKRPSSIGEIKRS